MKYYLGFIIITLWYTDIFMAKILKDNREDNTKFEQGRVYENMHIRSCYKDKNFSGFVWLNNSKLFTCEMDLRPGHVTYKKGD